MMRRYVHSRRRFTQNRESVSYRDFIGDPKPISVTRDKHPFLSLRRSRIVPRSHPERMDESEDGDEEVKERFVIWGANLPRVECPPEQPIAVPQEPRKVDFSVGSLPRAKGSGVAALGATKAFAAVLGPCPLRRRMQYSDEGYLRTRVKLLNNSRHERIETNRRSRFPTKEERELARFLRMALRPAMLMDTFPKSQILVKVLVIEDVGGILPAAVIASCMALMSSGLPCCDIITCGKIAVQSRNSIIRDPVKQQEFDLDRVLSRPENVKNFGDMTMAVLPHSNQVSLFTFRGKMDVRVFVKMTKKLRAEAWSYLDPMEQRMVAYAIWSATQRKPHSRAALMPPMEEKLDKVEVKAKAKRPPSPHRVKAAKKKAK